METTKTHQPTVGSSDGLHRRLRRVKRLLVEVAERIEDGDDAMYEALRDEVRTIRHCAWVTEDIVAREAAV